jgi:GNAT superfamily N-acetyltransferase
MTATSRAGGASIAAIRRARPEEAEAVASLYWRARRESEPAIPPLVHDRASVESYVRDVLMRDAEVWVAAGPEGLVGLMALVEPDRLEQIYVLQDATGHGLGSRFLSVARHRFPDGIQAWTFQSNTRARRFYERHGFQPVRWTDGDNEEGAPDVLYAWSPQH